MAKLTSSWLPIDVSISKTDKTADQKVGFFQTDMTTMVKTLSEKWQTSYCSAFYTISL